MSQRYFVETPITGSQATLVGQEAHHLAHVMRAKPGAQVTLFDGQGAEFLATVERVDRAAVTLAVQSRQEVNRELHGRLTVGVALPKGDRQKWLVEKLVELGATALVPLTTVRGVAQPTDNALERLERAVIEASKQCGRNCLMEIRQAVAWEQYVDQAGADCQRFVAHVGASSSSIDGLRNAGNEARAAEIVLAIGPEGGFTDEEIQRAQSAGWTVVGLGRRILRVETAALLLAGAAALQLEQDAGDDA